MANGETVTFSVKLPADVVKAVNVFAATKDRYVKDVVEEFIRDSLKRQGTSVEKLSAI